MIMGFRICLGVLVMLCSSPISSYIRGQLLSAAPPITLGDPVVVSGSHSGFGAKFQVLALVSFILTVASTRPRTTLPPFEECPSGYIMYTGRCGSFCYRFENQNCASFPNARQVCARDGGDLLNVDPCYYDFFKNIAENQEGCASDVWIGASSATPAVNYITVRGDSVPQNSVLWGFGEPDVGSEGGCLEMNRAFNFRLNDFTCARSQRFFCQVFF